MTKSLKNISTNIAIVVSMAMFFSCVNNIQEVRDLVTAKNEPIGIAENVHEIHTDSGRVTSKLFAPLLYDYSNRKKHPYFEFPKGVRIVTIDRKKDSMVIIGDYAISYSTTSISEIKGNVVIINYADYKKLVTEQIFWDEGVAYFYTEQPFTLYTKTDTIYGVGFDASQDFKNYTIKENRGNIEIKE